MALPAYVSDISDLAEGVRNFYIKNEDGTFRLDAEGVEDTSALKNALQRVRESNKKLSDPGISRVEQEELQTLRKQQEETKIQKLKDAEDYKALADHMDKSYSKKITDAEDRAKRAQDRLFNTLKENAATQAIAKHKGRIKPLLPHVIGHLDIVDNDGNISVVVKDGLGGVRLSKDNPKNSMSVEELVKNDFYDNEDFMGIFEGRLATGSGSTGGNGIKAVGGAITINKDEYKDLNKFKAVWEQSIKSGIPLKVV